MKKVFLSLCTSILFLTSVYTEESISLEKKYKSLNNVSAISNQRTSRLQRAFGKPKKEKQVAQPLFNTMLLAQNDNVPSNTTQITPASDEQPTPEVLSDSLVITEPDLAAPIIEEPLMEVSPTETTTNTEYAPITEATIETTPAVENVQITEEPTVNTEEITTVAEPSPTTETTTTIEQAPPEVPQEEVAPATEEEKVPEPVASGPGLEIREPDAEETLEVQTGKLLLNFENVKLANFVREIADLKKINLIMDPALEAVQISLSMRNPVNLEGAWRYLQTIMRLAGFVMVQVGDMYKIAPLNNATTEPLTFIGTDPELLPDSDQVVRYIAILQNVRVSEKGLQDMLLSMLSKSPNSMLIPQEECNAFVIADSAYNIKMALRVLNAIDRSGQAEVVAKIQLNEADANDVKELIEALTGAPGQDASPLAHLLRQKEEYSSSYFSKNLRVFADERLNALILLGTQESIDKIERFIKEEIDTSLADDEIDSPLHVYELQYTDATQIATFLNNTLKQQRQTVAGKKASKYGNIVGGTKYFCDSLTITPDVIGNRLLVSSIDKNDWKLLKQTIRNLDIPQPQVAIETLFVDVELTDNKSLGGQMRNKTHGMIGRNVDFQSTPIHNTIFQTNATGTTPISLLGDLINGLTGGLGKTLLTFGCDANIWAIFEMLRTITNTTIIAQPFLTVANKYQANILVGTTKQVQQSTAVTVSTDVKGFQQITASLELNVTPQINIDGIINLGIDLKREIFTDELGLNTSKQEVNTNVSIADGQILVLGGFVQSTVTETNAKVPILGDIPILGWMFKQKIKTVDRRTILMFMRPTIIKPRTMQGINPYTQMKLDEAKSFIDATVSKVTSDPIHNWFFDPKDSQYSYKVDDFATARYQPTTVDIKYDPYYRAEPEERKKRIKKDGHLVPTTNKVVAVNRKSLSSTTVTS